MIKSLTTLTRTEKCVYFQGILFTKDLQLFKKYIFKNKYTGPVNWAVDSSILILIDAFYLSLINQKSHFHIHI